VAAGAAAHQAALEQAASSAMAVQAAWLVPLVLRQRPVMAAVAVAVVQTPHQAQALTAS